MFKTFLIINVFNSLVKSKSTKYTTFNLEIELPFVPTPGLALQLPRNRALTITNVSWDVSQAFFRVYLEDYFEVSIGFDDITYSDWIEHFKDRGWSCIGEYDFDV